ncbi:RNA-directed DNA polymerase, eukaryota [Tanacetum coccineum]
MVDGTWIDRPDNVKKEFLDHFCNRFSKPGKPNATLQSDFPNQIAPDQRNELESDVSNDEIKKAVWECGTDKAPGPDGFTFEFFRHFWYLVERDVYEAVRPITLIGSIYKIIAKILTNRLVGVLGDIVNEVQSAFIKDRQILDGPFILNEVFLWCKRKRKQTLIFKVDFEKAYDSVRWDFLDDVLSKFGFGDKWRKWIQCCLHSSRGSIIINGSPTEEFQFGKGLKQGDPLSPFLFILIMETLHISFQRVVDAGMFHGIKLGGLVNLSHMFYADDAVFVGEWSGSNITTFVHVLDCFHKVFGLKINMSKSKIMGFYVDSGRVYRAAYKLGCLILKTPFLYLGSLVGGNMHRLQAWNDIVDHVRRRLSKWKMKMLLIGGRLTLIKSVLGSMPIFHMSMFKVPSGIRILRIHRIRIRCHIFIFNGHDVSVRKLPWVPMNKGSASKDNVNIVNEINVLAKKDINLMNYLHIKLGNGDSTLFWEDMWYDGGRLKDRFPRAYTLESCKSITVRSKLTHPNLSHSCRREPRGGVEQTQMDELAMQDRWTWSLNSSGEFSVASVRNLIDSRLLPKGDNRTRWIRYVPSKVNTLA